MTTTNDIDAIRARADAATKGPWTTGVRWEDPCDVYWLPINSPSTNAEEPHQPDRVALIRYETCGFQFPHYDALSDAAFIANARQDIPALLAKVDELTAEMAELRQRVADMPPAWATFTPDDMHAAGLETVAAEMDRDALAAEMAEARAALTEANRKRTVAEAAHEALTRDNTGYATQVEQMRAVVDAAKAWRDWYGEGDAGGPRQDALAAAVDALPKAEVAS